MPRVSFSNDYLLGDSCRTLHCFDRYYQRPSLITEIATHEQSATLTPNEIDEILSRKLYEQLKATSDLEKEQNLKTKSESLASPLLRPLFNSLPTGVIDSELIILIDRFFNLTYFNTIPMVNLLATAVATNFLKENIRELDKKLQEQQEASISLNIKRGTSLFCESESHDHDDDDDNVSWASAPT
ncbi:unnamed protein product [Rotaria sp. Silwood1]|nr:unnamed protein product [Rotaria sp. Silwood1]CAF3440079.1 unnamed protein product [Rotaria sp. Silwood1]CAF3484905.1 unnamed protein product [Rotaria sp. Silwood1]CAF3525573.1 unnamed protein product [Rotaria sp. Silwood1]CAF3534617.1 unnamed protein product [Rotaria sp. Silwood1]